MEYFLEQENLYRLELSSDELEIYEKNLAIIKLRPFLKLWILKHLGQDYLTQKYDKIKKHKEFLDFYYALVKDVY